ncbi:MAG: GNAT family N-acetyltransferase [Bacteroidota bacterium]
MVTIVAYTPEYAQAFRDLNLAWIKKYFVVEPIDLKSLDHPGKIIANGGQIFIALLGGHAVGACALVPMPAEDEYDYELSKMAVDPSAQGHGIGYQLAMKILDQARQLGARTVYLESNAILKPALKLYEKVGFVYLDHRTSAYERADVFMVCELS